MRDPSPPACLVVEVELSAAPPDRTARLVLDLGYADAKAAAVARDLADGVRSRVVTLLADRGTDPPAPLVLQPQLGGVGSAGVVAAAGAGLVSASPA